MKNLEAENEKLREQLRGYQNVTETDIENIAECVGVAIDDFLLSGEDVLIKVQTLIAKEIIDWFEIAGEDQS